MAGSKLQLALLALSVCAFITGSLAVTCGSLNDIPISGCSECNAINVTHSSLEDSWKARNLLHDKNNGNKGKDDDDDDDDDREDASSFLAPNCTACDSGYVLTPASGKSSGGPQRCGKCCFEELYLIR